MSEGALPAYTVRDADLARDREAMLAVWDGNLGEPARMREKFDWFYRRCPQGAPLVKLLEHAGQVVGVCAMGRRRMRQAGTALQAGVMVDIAVLPGHRTLGPALMMQEALTTRAMQELDLLYAFPNPRAVPVFRRLGYRPLGSMTRHVLVLRHAGYLRARLGALPAGVAGPLVDGAMRLHRLPQAARLALEWHAQPTAGIQRLCMADAPDGACEGVRDAGFLDWRFHPLFADQVRHALVRERASGEPVGWFAVGRQANQALVHDYRFVGGDEALRGGIAALADAMRAQGAASLAVSLHTGDARLAPWMRAGFSARSERPVLARWRGMQDGAPAPPLHLVAADEDE